MTMPPAPYPPAPSSQRLRGPTAGGRAPPGGSRPSPAAASSGGAYYSSGGVNAASSSSSLSSAANNNNSGGRSILPKSGGGGGSSGSRQSLPSRAAFVPGSPASDLYGCVNCSPLSRQGSFSGGADGAGDPSAGKAAGSVGGGGGAAARIKHGPALLEIRRLKYSLRLPGDGCDGYGGGEDDERDDGDKESSDRHKNDGGDRPLFLHETVLVSRGIPGLGGNVSSTCLDFRPAASDGSAAVVRCATGLTSGALCVHSLHNLYGESGGGDAPPHSTVAHYAPRQQRPATSVAWRPSSSGGIGGGVGGVGGGGNLVAVGLVGASGGTLSGSATAGSSPSAAAAAKSALLAKSMGVSSMTSSLSSRGIDLSGGGSSAASAAASALGSAAAVSAADRDFGVLVWDVEAQSSAVTGAGTVGGGGGSSGSGAAGAAAAVGASKSAGAVGGGKKGSAAVVPIKTPAYRYAHNSGVSSLSWLQHGQLLAVGCQRRSVQLYDLRVSGTNARPGHVYAHSDAVAGIVPDESGLPGTVFATFGRNPGEPVKVWDARMMDTALAEIVLPPTEDGGSGPTCVGAAAWSLARPGVLSVATAGGAVRSYDTRSPGSRALPVGVAYLDGFGGDDEEEGSSSVQCLAYQPQVFRVSGGGGGAPAGNPFEYYPHRALAVTSTGRVRVVPESQAAPLAVSRRDGRVAFSLGGTVWLGPVTEGPTAMDSKSILAEDVSARMMRRARCFHATRYSTDARDNVRLLEEEKEMMLAEEHSHLTQQLNEESPSPSSSTEFGSILSNIDQLLQCWRWIALVEHLSIDQQGGGSSDSAHSDENAAAWPAKGLIDAGVMKLLRMSSRDVPTPDENNTWMDTKSMSDTLFCDVFDSPMRRAALSACGWMKRYGILQDLLDDCENRGEFERSAALAVWHGDLNACVSALQRGAEDVRSLVEEEHGSRGGPTTAHNYSETLSLIAMCVAGFNVITASDGAMKTTTLWNNSCETLLRRLESVMAKDNSAQPHQLPGVAYLRAILLFLQNIGSEAGFSKTIYNEGISLADRVGFACRFLPRADLYAFLDTSMRSCIKLGNLEGLLITGLDKRGIGLLQSYMDRNSDVQTAALVTARVVLPNEWPSERRMCMEWLESYRLFLNGLQMWNSRAAFDVGRFEHLRRLKQGSGAIISSSGRHTAAAKKQLQKDKSQANNNFPPQLWARCNYCNASLPLSKLRRQEGIANSWLSRQKPLLTCCPQCKKPLPRCSICLLSLGCLNPYMELQRERNQYPRSGMPMLGGGGGAIQGMDDLSGLANIPFASWWSWCMRCKHGGHAHHLCGWFEKHDTCAVSGCDCRCQFDAGR